MRKIFSVAIMGFLLLSVSSVSAHNSGGSSSGFSTDFDSRKGADKAEDHDDDDDVGAGTGGDADNDDDDVGAGAGGGADNDDDDAGAGTGGDADNDDDDAGAGTGGDASNGAGGGVATGAIYRGGSGGGDDTMRLSNTHHSAFEGIWHLDDRGENWIGVTVSGNKIILLKYEPGVGSSALAGSLVGNVASLGFSVDASSFSATLTLLSSTTAILNVLSCESKQGLTCSFPAGSVFRITKVFE